MEGLVLDYFEDESGDDPGDDFGDGVLFLHHPLLTGPSSESDESLEFLLGGLKDELLLELEIFLLVLFLASLGFTTSESELESFIFYLEALVELFFL